MLKDDNYTALRAISPKQAEEIVNLGRVTIWRLENEGLFPRRRQLSKNRVAYLSSEIEEWLKGRPVVGGARVV